MRFLYIFGRSGILYGGGIMMVLHGRMASSQLTLKHIVWTHNSSKEKYYRIFRRQGLDRVVPPHGKILSLSRCLFVPGQESNFCPFVPKSCIVQSHGKAITSTCLTKVVLTHPMSLMVLYTYYILILLLYVTYKNASLHGLYSANHLARQTC